MLIKTIDLICISEGAKALKQKTVLFKNNMLYGLDNINGYLIYTSLVGKIQDDFSYDQGIIINQIILSILIYQSYLLKTQQVYMVNTQVQLNLKKESNLRTIMKKEFRLQV